MQTEASLKDEVLEQAWRDVIVDHNQFPRCVKAIKLPSHHGQGNNPFCGDQVSLSLRVASDGMIEEAGIEISGCAISTASASLMASQLAGLHVNQARELFEKAHSLLTAAENQPTQTLGDLEALRLIHQFPLRVKCASLAWHVLSSILSGSEEVISTE